MNSIFGAMTIALESQLEIVFKVLAPLRSRSLRGLFYILYANRKTVGLGYLHLIIESFSALEVLPVPPLTTVCGAPLLHLLLAFCT